jgi:hypothetical protein
MGLDIMGLVAKISFCVCVCVNNEVTTVALFNVIICLLNVLGERGY